MTRTSLSVVELLIPDEAIPHDVRMALAEGRTEAARLLLMEMFDLDFWETKMLLGRRCS